VHWFKNFDLSVLRNAPPCRWPYECRNMEEVYGVYNILSYTYVHNFFFFFFFFFSVRQQMPRMHLILRLIVQMCITWFLYHILGDGLSNWQSESKCTFVRHSRNIPHAKTQPDCLTRIFCFTQSRRKRIMSWCKLFIPHPQIGVLLHTFPTLFHFCFHIAINFKSLAFQMFQQR
jgi:hypothetical protein